MSVTCSCILVLFLLCLALHACNARTLLGDVYDKKKSDEKFDPHHYQHFLTEGHHGENTEPNEKSTSLNMEAQISTDSSTKTQYNKDVMERPKELMKKGKGDLNGVRTSTTESDVSVSWRVPHEKRGEKQPGFNLDYSPPKTHPPSHN
ncbi:root meristem growth factor 10 [Humulus lupulus]|uniref:root meristem growth factor 10 n=1 Tax=Humulus lupulus TaxID=3486 RepID=UPI002B4014CA|nr:root meristem growth factor 10 [Humulus lupulus]